MSTFHVCVETVDEVRPHTNADRLAIATLVGMTYQFVIGKGSFKPGDKVLYFPLDALLPPALIEALGLTGKLSGGAKNRVKTIKLRGEISQGLVGSLDLLSPEKGLVHGVDVGPGMVLVPTAEVEDWAQFLSVTKYVPPEPGQSGMQGARREKTLPDGVSHYDIESCDAHKAHVTSMMEWPVLVTEKLEGAHTAITRTSDGVVTVCSRNHALIRPDDLETCVWHRGCRNSGLFDAIERLALMFPTMRNTIRGELIGPTVQKNHYGLPQNEVLVFDIEIGGKLLHGEAFLSVCAELKLKTVPILGAPGATLGTIMQSWPATNLRAMSDGMSLITPTKRREGIVVKPWAVEHETVNLRGVGRPILKQRSPEYLTTADT